MGKFRRSYVSTGFAVLTVMLSHAAGFKAASAEVRNLTQPGAFAIEASPSGASFQRQGRIEQQTASGWETVFDEFYLVSNCSAVATVPACVTLAPGTVLRPVPWNGYTCYGQCPRPCKGNVYRPPGTFRLVLTACGEGAGQAGPPFFMGRRAKQ
jgi:hypothetical protein